MKLLSSEHVSDYGHYVFPYAVWAFPEKGEKPRQLFDAGFLPSTPALDRFYLCRQVRVNLGRFKPSSENRRILRKGEGIRVRLEPRSRFNYSSRWREFCRAYAEVRFGAGTMTTDRLDRLFQSPVVTHLLVSTDTGTGEEVGLAAIFCDGRAMAFYYYAFYSLDYLQRNLGMFMMTSAVGLFAARGVRHLYLGSCYSKNALYKTQFEGAEFFNGFCWSGNRAELKHLLARDEPGAAGHALENEEFQRLFYEGDVRQMTRRSPFRVRLPRR